MPKSGFFEFFICCPQSDFMFPLNWIATPMDLSIVRHRCQRYQIGISVCVKSTLHFLSLLILADGEHYMQILPFHPLTSSLKIVNNLPHLKFKYNKNVSLWILVVPRNIQPCIIYILLLLLVFQPLIPKIRDTGLTRLHFDSTLWHHPSASLKYCCGGRLRKFFQQIYI